MQDPLSKSLILRMSWRSGIQSQMKNLMSQDEDGENDENYVNYYEKSEHEYDEGENQQDSYEDEYCDDQRG